MDNQGASQFFGGQGTAVQTKTVAILSGRKSVVEDPGKVLRLDAHAVVNDRDPDAILAFGNLDDYLFIAST